MTYNAQEASIADGRPYWLYQFARGATVTRLVAAPVQVTVGGHTWDPSSIKHAELEQTGNVERSELELEFPLSDTFAFDLLAPATEVTTITLFRAHYSDGANELRQYWKGRIVGAESGGLTIKVKTENVFTSLRRPGCRVRVQRSCRHDHYGLECGVDKTAFDVSATITAISGLALTVPAASGAPDGRYNAGMVKWTTLYGFIESHVGSTLTLVSEIPGLEAALGGGSQAATLYPGCDRSQSDTTGCGFYSNDLNYGGFRWLPSNNPFNDSLV